MTAPLYPDILRFGTDLDPFKLEFDRRTGPYSMNSNHYHFQHEIFYLFQGERNYFVKDTAYHIRPGDLVLVESNALHKTSESGRPNHERIVVYYSPGFFAALRPEEKELLLAPFIRHTPVIRLNLQEQMQVEQLLYSMLDEMNGQTPGYTLKLQNVTAELLLFIARTVRKHGAQPENLTSPAQRKVTEIVRHINQHYGEALQLDDIAEAFYISKSHLSRSFKKITGFGYTEYVNLIRVRESERLLRETGWSVTRISEHCGFDSLTHFGKVFKHIAGVPPREYRKLHRI
ncbi:helix-turn-helix transcriptional regulator [Paenibacillus camerounensis]|uniref:helix-turn-helix transcriptional regulator n=1 Tax=Paenibacillus camerounensis TaxID=1243663 RepID=UPI0005AA7851|nr:helix-turn-helix domain-containing protein [Paenibacillus camerounensis]